MERDEPKDDDKQKCEVIVEPEKRHFPKKKKITEINEIKENIRFQIWTDTEDHTQGMKGVSKMVSFYVQGQKRREEEIHITGLGDIVSKHSGAKVEQYTVMNNYRKIFK